jgi:predicted nucleic acid-binding protein
VIVLDANVLIAYLDDTHVYHQRAVEVLVSDDDLRIAPLTIAEVLVHPARTGDAAAVLSRLRAVGVTVDQGAADPIVLATLRAETPLKMPDAIVVELAIRLECAVASFDGRVVEVARGRAPTDRPPTVRPRQAGVASGAAAGAVGT